MEDRHRVGMLPSLRTVSANDCTSPANDTVAAARAEDALPDAQRQQPYQQQHPQPAFFAVGYERPYHLASMAHRRWTGIAGTEVPPCHAEEMSLALARASLYCCRPASVNRPTRAGGVLASLRLLTLRLLTCTHECHRFSTPSGVHAAQFASDHLLEDLVDKS